MLMFTKVKCVILSVYDGNPRGYMEVCDRVNNES